MKWKAKIIRHRGENRIIVQYEKTEDNFNILRNFGGRKWSQTLGAWHLPDTIENRRIFSLNEDDAIKERPEIGIFRNLLQSKRYSQNTIKTYTEALRVFLNFFKGKPAAGITNDDIIFYNNEYILKNKLSSSYQNQIVNAIKLYFLTVEDKQLEIEKIHRPKKEKLLPNVLSKAEIKLILNAHANIKHRTMLSLIYSCGLRRSELLNLKPLDIDSKRNIIIVRNAKGKKDRIVPLSVKILALLREYYIYCKPKVWLFEGYIAGEQYDARSLAYVLKHALHKANISKPVSLHWLRHSYATHLLESGTDLRYIQEILGHQSSRTTEIYTHVSTRSIQMIKSPFDEL